MTNETSSSNTFLSLSLSSLYFHSSLPPLHNKGLLILLDLHVGQVIVIQHMYLHYYKLYIMHLIVSPRREGKFYFCIGSPSLVQPMLVIIIVHTDQPSRSFFYPKNYLSIYLYIVYSKSRQLEIVTSQ